jgi:cell shape-determining protein MreC
MEGIYIFILIILVIAIFSMFFIVWKTKLGVIKTSKELGLELKNVQKPFYTPMSLISNFFKFLLSFPRK